MATADYQLSVQCEPPRTIRERMNDRKARLEEDLANVNAAIAALDETPNFEKIHNAISKAGY